MTANSPGRARSPILVALMLAVLCAVAPAAPRRQAEPDASRLSAKDRREILEEVWETINEKYYSPSFNGVDWRAVLEQYRPRVEAARTDEEFYTVMKRMVGELKDAHTRFHTPRERQERERLQATSIGLFIFEIEGKPVVLSVVPGSDAARAGVEPGMLVRTIDGQPVEARLAEAQKQVAGSSTERADRLRLYRRVIEKPPGEQLRLGLTRASGEPIEVMLTSRVISEAPSITTRMLPSGPGYVRLNVWKSPAHKEFKRALEGMRRAPGVIIDLRGNPGGEVNEVLKIASYFLPDRTYFGRFVTRSGRNLDLYAGDDDDQVYAGPVVILVNEGSGSGSEMFAAVMQETGRAMVVGRQSCGCLLGITRFKKLKGGSELAVSELGYLSPRGNALEGAGIRPDHVADLTIADLQQRRDRALEVAERLLRQRSGARRPAARMSGVRAWMFVAPHGAAAPFHVKCGFRNALTSNIQRLRASASAAPSAG